MSQPVLYRFTREDYERVSHDLWPNERTELLNGEVFKMAPIGTKHLYFVSQLHEAFVLAFTQRAMVIAQNPFNLSPNSEGQPDLMLLRLPRTVYLERLPEPQDILLLVEVSDSTLSFDRNEKLPLYAHAGIPEVWILNIAKGNKSLELYRAPEGDSYTQREILEPGQPVAPLAFPHTNLVWWH